MRTLAIDIGGSGIKALLLNESGTPLTEPLRVETPQPAPPGVVLALIEKLARRLGAYDRVAVGFPGVVRRGRTLTAHLHPDWIGLQFDEFLARHLGRPVRVANDADVQGLASIRGEGVELVLTLGTGLGSSLFVDGRLCPNLQLAHQPFRRDRTYEQLLGNAAFVERGSRRWNRDLERALVLFEKMFQFDACYIGGGNAMHVRLELPAHIRLVPNINGLLGGIALWQR